MSLSYYSPLAAIFCPKIQAASGGALRRLARSGETLSGPLTKKEHRAFVGPASGDGPDYGYPSHQPPISKIQGRFMSPLEPRR